MSRRQAIRTAGVLLLAAGLVVGAWLLLAPGATEEELVARALEDAEQAFEEGDVGDVMERIHSDFKGSVSNAGKFDADQLKATLRGLLVAQKKRFSLDVGERTIEVDGSSAHAKYRVHGSERGGGGLLGSGGRDYDVDARLVKEEGDWLIRELNAAERK